jgi:hypothetical protein
VSDFSGGDIDIGPQFQSPTSMNHASGVVTQLDTDGRQNNVAQSFVILAVLFAQDFDEQP